MGRHGHFGTWLRRDPTSAAPPSARWRPSSQLRQIGVAEAALSPTLSINGIIGYDSGGSKAFRARVPGTGPQRPTFSWNILNYGRITQQRALPGRPGRRKELIATYQKTTVPDGRRPRGPDSSPGLLDQGTGQDIDAGRQRRRTAAPTRCSSSTHRHHRIQQSFYLETYAVQQQDTTGNRPGAISLSN